MRPDRSTSNSNCVASPVAILTLHIQVSDPFINQMFCPVSCQLACVLSPASLSGRNIRLASYKLSQTSPVPCRLVRQERKVEPLLSFLAHQPPSPAGRAGRGREESCGNCVAVQPSSPAGPAGRGLANRPDRDAKFHVQVGPQPPPPPPPIPMSTVNSPTAIVLGGGSGMSAPGSITISPTRAAGLPPIRQM